MFVFDNLLALDDKNLGTLIRNVDSEILTKSLKGVDETIRNRFLGCMSARAADGIRDEMEARGPMKLAEVLEAQKAMIAIARGLAKDGTILCVAPHDDRAHPGERICSALRVRGCGYSRACDGASDSLRLAQLLV
jgi:flagellar motor switch protein FliG